MTSPAQNRRRGMTLIELLVVVLILGLLSVVVLPNLGNTAERRRFREAARGISTFIARAQSRAINAAGPRGFMIQPLPALPMAGVDLSMANAPPAYGGTTVGSRASVTPPAAGAVVAAVTFLDANGGIEPPDSTFAEGDSIQFGGLGPSYMFRPPNRIAMWTNAGQNPAVSPWPQTPPGGVPYRIIRQPRRASSGVFQMQRGAALDLFWSTLGARQFGGPGGIIVDQTKPVALLFDQAGRPLELVHSGGRRERVTEPLFLLVGSAELAGNQPVGTAQVEGDLETRTGANWQQSDAVWLCVDNHTGVVKFGAITPDAADVWGSQWYIRQTVGLGVAE